MCLQTFKILIMQPVMSFLSTLANILNVCAIHVTFIINAVLTS